MRRPLRCLALLFALANTESARADVLIAVGTDYREKLADGEGYRSAPIVMRLETGDDSGYLWTNAAMPGPRPSDVAPQALGGAAFSSATTAWAFGGSEIDPVLFRSDDTGKSWTDVSDSLPDGMRSHRVRGLVFTGENDGWLLSTHVMGLGPYVWRTRNAGRDWEALPPLKLGVGSNWILFGSGLDVQLLEASGDQTTLQPIGTNPKDHKGDEVDDDKSDGIGSFRATAITGNAGGRWITGVLRGEANADSAIYSQALGRTWTRQSAGISQAQLRAIDFADENYGLACGGTPADNVRPVCAYTNDGGLT